jgi:hypothetical protein
MLASPWLARRAVGVLCLIGLYGMKSEARKGDNSEF